METYKGLPLFNLDIIGDIAGVELISLVDSPAVQREFIKFRKEMEAKFTFNEEKHIVTGVALIPGQKIYRADADGEYYVQFSREAIERIAQKFFADRHSSDANVMHEIPIDGVVYFESYLINKERGILPVEFNDLPDGTWMVSAKIENPELWKLIKEGVLRGFSIEGQLILEPAEEKPLSTIDELINYIKNK